MVADTDGPAAQWLHHWLDELSRAEPGSVGEGAIHGAVEVRPTRSGALVVVRGEEVVKLHHPRTDAGALSDRLRLARTPDLARLLVSPLSATPQPVPDGVSTRLGGTWRWASSWPLVDVLDPSGSAADDVPWAEAGALIAGLHRTALPTEPRSAQGALGVPPAGDLARLDRALHRLEHAEPGVAQADSDRGAVLRAGTAVRAELDDRAPGSVRRPRSLVHGDWHLGQLGRRPAGRADDRHWRLIDVDDLGIGCPATDLARPAGFWAAGLLDDASWSAFVDGYREGGGPAVPATGEVWPQLDAHARAAVVVAAARSVLGALGSGAPVDDDGTALVQACHRMLGENSATAGTRGAAGRRPG